MPNPTLVRNAQIRFMRMCSTFEAEPIIAYAVSHGLSPSISSGHYVLKGLLQWLACHDCLNTVITHRVMLKGPVYTMHQAFILNTVLYGQFCQRYVGEFVHILNINTPEQADIVRKTGWFEETVEQLGTVFGSDLSPELLLWQHQMYSAASPVAAVSVFSHDTAKHRQIADVQPWRTQRTEAPFTHLHGRRGTTI
jgi:hypothetical protein